MLGIVVLLGEVWWLLDFRGFLVGLGCILVVEGWLF